MVKLRLALLACSAAAGCGYPVHLERVEALGEESSDTPVGPLHRPGQPCLVCHGPDGPAESELAVAGTVYLRPDAATPAEGARVVIVDADGKSRTATTNAAGNFYLEASDSPIFPNRVEVRSGELSVPMRTTIGRDGSCAACHVESGDSSHVPRVYLGEGGGA